MYNQYPPYYAQQRYGGCLKFILYVISFFVPLIGIIIGVIFMSRPDPESKGVGRTCLVVSIISFVLYCCSGLTVGLLPVLLELIGGGY